MQKTGQTTVADLVNRREFLRKSSKVLAATAAMGVLPAVNEAQTSGNGAATARKGNQKLAKNDGKQLLMHRFGVNYVPSLNWYYCWNNWQPSSIARDLD